MLRVTGISAVIVLALATTAFAQDDYEVVASDLANPTGVAVQPGTGHVFVAESGAGRVLRIVGGEPEEVISGFPLGEAGEGPAQATGMLELAFFDAETLIVSGGKHADAEEVIRVYELPAVGEAALAAEDVKKVLGPLVVAGNYTSVAVTPTALYASATEGDHSPGWVVRSEITGTRFGELTDWLATEELAGVAAPGGVTISPRGELVIGQRGDADAGGDGLLTFFSDDGVLLLELGTGLREICALTYSPQEQLYALDFFGSAPAEGGLFRLEKRQEPAADTCDAVRVLTLARPTAMAFGEDGSLYVTLLGTAEGGEQPAGQLIRIPPGL